MLIMLQDDASADRWEKKEDKRGEYRKPAILKKQEFVSVA